jgi:hypothetical protein
LASEIVAGIITGSRLWIWEKQEKVCSWIAPRLTATLESVNAEAEANWGSCLATIYSMCDIRAVSWLTEILFSLAKKPSDNSYHGKV